MNFNLRSHLTYANVVATLALVFAMSGGALAASHYLINSTRQINPKVLGRLRGSRGPRGPAGVPGLSIQGPSGASIKGPKGDPGHEGHEGHEGFSALSALPSEVSESGVYGIATPNSSSSGSLEQTVSFALRLSAPVPVTKVEYEKLGAPTSNCAGPGKAASGYLCIYSASSSGVKAPVVFESEDVLATPGSGHLGFTLQWTVEAPNAGDVGSYTVTAP